MAQNTSNPHTDYYGWRANFPAPPAERPKPVGMRVNVVELRKDGARLSDDELAAAMTSPKTGRLILGRETGAGRVGKPVFISTAQLFADTRVTPRHCQSVLYEPTVLSIDERGIVLHGHEIRSTAGGKTPIQLVQVWLVKTISE